jgi:hypothetical protein
MSVPNQTISFEVSKEVYDRLVDLAVACGGSSPEETAKFAFEQALEAPEAARRWMIAKRLSQVRGYEGHRNPEGKNCFEGYADVIREQVEMKHRPALNLAEAVRAVV